MSLPLPLILAARTPLPALSFSTIDWSTIDLLPRFRVIEFDAAPMFRLPLAWAFIVAMPALLLNAKVFLAVWPLLVCFALFRPLKSSLMVPPLNWAALAVDAATNMTTRAVARASRPTRPEGLGECTISPLLQGGFCPC